MLTIFTTKLYVFDNNIYVKKRYKTRKDMRKINNTLLITKKRIQTTFIDLGLNIYINYFLIFNKKRYMFNIFFDIFFQTQHIFIPLFLKYYNDLHKLLIQRIKTYKFYRLLAFLPVRGQNTHSNTRTCKYLLSITPFLNVIKFGATKGKKKSNKKLNKKKKC